MRVQVTSDISARSKALWTGYGAKRWDQTYRLFEKRGDSPLRNRQVVLSLCVDNVYRMRLYMETRVAGNYLLHPMYVIEKDYLDGLHQEDVLTYGEPAKTSWEYQGMNIVPSQTKDIVDFGRLDQAVQGLVTIMSRLREGGGEITDEQAASLVASRAAIKEWQERAHRELAVADGQIEMLDKVYRSVFGVQS